MKNTTAKGKEFETIAENHYRQLGFCTLDRNFRRKTGEIDLVMQKEGLLLFLEVKGRSADWEMHAWGPTLGLKLRRLRATIRGYLQANPNLEFSEIKIEIAFVTQGRVAARFDRI